MTLVSCHGNLPKHLSESSPTQDAEENWLVSVAQKKEMYGALRVPVGGKNEPDDSSSSFAYRVHVCTRLRNLSELS